MCFTASSSIPSRSNRPGLEHIENPPTTDTPGIKKSTLKTDWTQKFKKEANNPQSWTTIAKIMWLPLFQLSFLYNIFISVM